jgi:GT2 family glycosyltransferase
MPDADIVILSWDRIDDTIEAIQSALEQVDVHAHIIVIDQGSRAGGLARLRSYCMGRPDVTLICNERNTGVPGGRNQGAAAGRGRTIVILDNDGVFATPHCVRQAVDRLGAQPGTGALSFCIECYDTLGGVTVPDHSSWIYGLREASRWWRERFQERSFVGAGAALRRSVFDTLGGFDANLFFLHEEEDLSDRIINIGYAIEYSGDIVVRHKVSAERRTAWAGPRMFYHARNRLYLNVKQGRSRAASLADVTVILVAAIRGGSLWSALKGTLSGLALLPEAFLTARHPYCRRTQSGSEYLERLAHSERQEGVQNPLERYSGVQRFVRRLKWQTGFARDPKPLNKADL